MVTHLWLVENGFLSAVCVAVVMLQEVGIAGEAQDMLAHGATITYNHLFYQSVLNNSEGHHQETRLVVYTLLTLVCIKIDAPYPINLKNKYPSSPAVH